MRFNDGPIGAGYSLKMRYGAIRADARAVVKDHGSVYPFLAFTTGVAGRYKGCLSVLRTHGVVFDVVAMTVGIALGYWVQSVIANRRFKHISFKIFELYYYQDRKSRKKLGLSSKTNQKTIQRIVLIIYKFSISKINHFLIALNDKRSFWFLNYLIFF